MRTKAFVSFSLFCSLFAGAFLIDRDMTRENAPGTGADKERQYRGDYIPFEAGSGNQSLEKKESAPFKSREYIRVEKR
ncbi:hypothetical protein OZL92_10595 [Bacillus sonorensis]|mgnify:CR=1 FL=1|uniref:Uncharacterized protein n=2 Tax=Bacillus sonorensis TaxID=119858 RepID=M5P0N6_9BACI|nr:MULTISPECIES: hypothetical protein [Bacillus]ASB90566.1 hypothetical protein S101395_04064 [Bacillus sonorensis]EME72968.1 hypothetical protein BSONL12_14559 [Bacillus sonorensis L12]MBG9913984.1 hypothetical protein [Bacillus sonorensis]MCF7616790.1 hypothetical protein [Bacillus sonorensis]MCY7857285.1 hypothetical protein [Bacillus sonorensis]